MKTMCSVKMLLELSIHWLEYRNCVPFVIEPGKEFGGVPICIRRLPVTIGPDNIRLVVIHDLV